MGGVTVVHSLYYRWKPTCIYWRQNKLLVTFDIPYCVNCRLFLFKEFAISYSDIIRSQNWKLVTFQIDTWNVIRHSTLLDFYAMREQIMDYTTRHRCIQSVEGKSQHFRLQIRLYWKALKQIEIRMINGPSVDPLSRTYAIEESLTFSMVTFR